MGVPLRFNLSLTARLQASGSLCPSGRDSSWSLRTKCMEQSPSWEASQEITLILILFKYDNWLGSCFFKMRIFSFAETLFRDIWQRGNILKLCTNVWLSVYVQCVPLRERVDVMMNGFNRNVYTFCFSVHKMADYYVFLKGNLNLTLCLY
jgi:hypothetical protein